MPNTLSILLHIKKYLWKYQKKKKPIPSHSILFCIKFSLTNVQYRFEYTLRLTLTKYKMHVIPIKSKQFYTHNIRLKNCQHNKNKARRHITHDTNTMRLLTLQPKISQGMTPCNLIRTLIRLKFCRRFIEARQ